MDFADNITKKRPIPFFGIFLIIIGFGILFDRLNIIDFGWNKLWQFEQNKKSPGFG
jgi:hypothetical protein